MASLGCFWHLLPAAAVQDGLGAAAAVGGPAELFEEEGDRARLGLVSEFAGPGEVHGPGWASAFAAGDDPLDVSGFDPRGDVEGSQEWLGADELDRGWEPGDDGDAGRVLLGFDRCSEPDVGVPAVEVSVLCLLQNLTARPGRLVRIWKVWPWVWAARDITSKARRMVAMGTAGWKKSLMEQTKMVAGFFQARGFSIWESITWTSSGWVG